MSSSTSAQSITVNRGEAPASQRGWYPRPSLHPTPRGDLGKKADPQQPGREKIPEEGGKEVESCPDSCKYLLSLNHVGSQVFPPTSDLSDHTLVYASDFQLLLFNEA